MCDPIINFFYRRYPYSQSDAANTSKNLKKPGKIAHHITRNMMNDEPIVGIVSTYGGYVQVSNNVGQTTFPRKHSKSMVYVLVTTKITPIVMFANTIHHFALEAGVPANMYSIERKIDINTNIYFWEVQQVPLPQDNNIPREAIVIITKPNYIYIPTGITLTQNSPDLMLPDIYVKKGIDPVYGALYMLNINHFFRPIPTWYKRKSDGYSYQFDS